MATAEDVQEIRDKLDWSEKGLQAVENSVNVVGVIGVDRYLLDLMIRLHRDNLEVMRDMVELLEGS